MHITRTLEATARDLASQYPVIAITGPRQSGKTTLARHVFPDKAYVSLEDLDEREFATSDPRGFLARFPEGAIFDEVQRVPTLFSYLQTRVDQDPRAGRYVLTGSQQFAFLAGVTQSLAGRVALLTLLPFSYGELERAKSAPRHLMDLLFDGLYPPIHDRGLDATTWYGNYIQTYIERDVRQIINVRDASTFRRFVALCAGRTGQLLNLSSLASDAAVSHTTARGWISLLEAGYLVRLVPPHHSNFNKRLVKTPKLYFLDTGLACRLLGIQKSGQLDTHPLRGPLFETWVVSELLKARLHRGKPDSVYFWRDRSGHEVDILIENGDVLTPVEVKSGQTLASDFTRGLTWWCRLAGARSGDPYLVYGGGDSFKRQGVQFVSWRDVWSALSPSAEE